MDISDRKKGEKAPYSERSRFEILIDNAPFGLMLTDENRNLTYVNPMFTQLFGYALDDIKSVTGWFAAAYPDVEYRQKVLSCWEKDFKGNASGINQQRIFTVTCKDGSQKEVSFVVTRLNENEVLTSCEDVTERKRLADQLIQAQKMEAIGTLAGGIAHDFNNLLMGILGYASLMLTDTDSQHPFYEKLRMIEDQVISGANLSKQLLGFARGGKYEIKTTDLNEVLSASSEMFGRTKKDVIIHKKFDPALYTVDVDRPQIEQVLLNLYVNAWHAMPSGGEINLETQNVSLDEHSGRIYNLAKGNYVKMSVTDTGVGMDKATQQRIFEPFFTTKKIGRGSGLGLASAYGIIKSHGGRINVYSEKGKGTVFTIYLPASENEVSSENNFPSELINGSETILLVDDQEIITGVGQVMLTKLGYEVFCASGGKEAVELYQSRMADIDLVILDMIMPAMNGSETYDALVQIDPSVKVILSSGYSINGQATKILKRGCNGFIQKPFNLNELSQKVREVLDCPPALPNSSHLPVYSIQGTAVPQSFFRN